MSRKRSLRPVARIFTFMIMSALLVACGGGGGGGAGGGGGGGSTPSAPQGLALDTSYGKSISNVYPMQYFYFTTNSAGKYEISLSNVTVDVGWTIFSGNDFATSLLDFCDSSWSSTGDESCSISLDASTTYYLMVTNWDGVWGDSGAYDIKIAEFKSEGLGTPVALTVGQTHGGMVDMSASSYYMFTAPASSEAYVLISNPTSNLDITVYDNSSFSSGILDTCSVSSGSSTQCSIAATSGVTYYVKVTELLGAEATFNIAAMQAMPSPAVFDFEDGLFPPVFTNGTGVSYDFWYPVSGVSNSGSYSLRAQLPPASSYNCFTYKPGYIFNTVAFTFKTDTDYYSSLYFYVDGVQMNWWAGGENWTEALYLLPSGGTSLKWCRYRSLYSSPVGQNTVWIDDIEAAFRTSFGEGAPGSAVALSLSDRHRGTVAGGSSSYYQYTAQSGTAQVFSIDKATSAVGVSVYDNAAFTGTPIKTCSAGTSLQCVVNNSAPGTDFYIEVSGSSNALFSMSISEGLSEGSVASPVNLSIGSPHSGSADAGSSSYYSFTTTEAGSYLVGVDNTPYYYVYVYSDPSFSSLVKSCYSGSTWPCAIGSLSNSTTYYVKYDNSSGGQGRYYTIDISAGGSEGAPGAPVGLVPEQEHTGTLDTGVASYYAFTPIVNGVHHIGFVNMTGAIDWRLYSDGAYSAQLDSCTTGSEKQGMFCATTALNAGTTYYLKVSDSAAGTYTVLVTSSGFGEGSVGSPVTLALDSPHTGGVDEALSSYYRFTASDIPGDYGITVNGQVWNVVIYVFSLSDFTSTKKYCGTMSPGATCTVTGLTPETDYYVRVDGNANHDVPEYTLEVISPTLAGCLGGGECSDLEGGSFPSAFTNATSNSSPSAAGWVVDGSRSANGSYSLVSDNISNFDDACFDYTPSIMTNAVSFNYMTDTEPGSDYLNFYTDGVLTDSWSGLNYWAQTLYVIGNAPAYHTYTWCYVKDNNGAVGADSAWVDDISAFELASVLYDFNDGQVPANFVNSGDANWDNDAGSLVSGIITDNQSTCIETTEVATMNISFDLTVSSESGWDFLKFYIDGVQQDSWSGSTSQSPSYSLTGGTYTFKWCYIKDSIYSAGSDAAWIDNVLIY